MVVSQIMAEIGFQCLSASSGEEALAILTETPVDVMITDVAMTGMDGIELAAEAKRRFDVDSIVITGHTREYTFDKIIAAGAKDFIAKPFHNHEFIVRLKRVIRERELLADRNRAETALKNSESRLRALTVRLKEVEEDLRKAIARELHDRVGQNLSALNLNLSLLQGYLPDGMAKKTKRVMDDSIRLLGETTEHIRDVMARLRPVGIEEYGLAAAINWCVRRFSDRTGIKVETDLDGYVNRLPLPCETELFRIAQEAFTNILKHAQAKSVTISLRPVGDRLRLVIADDGRGFDTRDLQISADPHAGWGLVSMKERVYGLNGKFKVVSEPGKGTIVVVEVNRF